MSTLFITVNVTTPDAEDKRAMITRIVKANSSGRQVPLPFDTAANIKTSYETILREGDSSEHLDNIANASTSDGLQFNGFSDADLNAIRQKLADLSQAGTPIATIIGKVQAL